MNGTQHREIAHMILEALYDAWERHIQISLNTVQEQGEWDKSVFRTVVDKLDIRQGLIKNVATSYTFELTSSGVLYAEENEIVPKDKAGRHQKVRQRILAILTDIYDKEGSRAYVHFEKLAEGVSAQDSMEIRRDVSLLIDIGDVEAASTSTFKITDQGVRSYRGSDYEDII